MAEEEGTMSPTRQLACAMLCAVVVSAVAFHLMARAQEHGHRVPALATPSPGATTILVK